MCAGNKHKGQEAVHVGLICIHKTEKHRVFSLLLESQPRLYLFKYCTSICKRQSGMRLNIVKENGEVENGFRLLMLEKIRVDYIWYPTVPSQSCISHMLILTRISKTWLTSFPLISMPFISSISSPSDNKPLLSAAPPRTIRLTTTLSISLRTVAPYKT